MATIFSFNCHSIRGGDVTCYVLSLCTLELNSHWTKTRRWDKFSHGLSSFAIYTYVGICTKSRQSSGVSFNL